MFIGLSRYKRSGEGVGGWGLRPPPSQASHSLPPGVLDPAELASTISHNLHTFQRKQKRYNNIYFFNLLEVGHTESNISLITFRKCFIIKWSSQNLEDPKWSEKIRFSVPLSRNRRRNKATFGVLSSH
jgi:hypothetical protein